MIDPHKVPISFILGTTKNTMGFGGDFDGSQNG
jgi:hypothetical protein